MKFPTFALVILCAALLIGMAACKASTSKYMNKIVDNNYTVDGVKLDFDGQTTLDIPYSSSELEIDEGVLQLALQGKPEANLKLQIKYREYEIGDASFSIEDGKLVHSTRSGKPTAIKEINGIIPDAISLKLNTGTGSIELADLKASPKVEVNCGTASLSIKNSSIDILEADTGTGSINISDSEIESAELSTGTGDINLKATKINERKFDTGTGKISEN